ncbi:hypothetical protein BLL42_10800 [Pseudomonas frederiksbergensis]|uniref:Uncharacterized protein n=1 Tax=Pseudomonas frederiksbergensis TaxID=104087 RepID=A0A1J0EJP1_9PSED|nr:hypothetical protein [Pseudomonas frederiksbergensis]APC16191.1 hypothetical protein BLL42_10800 [Pseudomonas frederiksbergensis]
MHMEQRLEFIDTLPALPASNFTPRIATFSPPTDPNKESGTVGPEMMNIYMPGVSDQNRKDVDNCKLLVQNAASQKYDPIKQLHEWYTYYTESLAKLGWVTQASQVKNITIKKTGLTMDAVAIEILQGLVGANAPQLLALTGKAVAGVKDDQGLISIYNRNAKVGYEAKFDMSPVWQTRGGSPMMVLNCTSVDVRESKRGILWWKSTTQSTAIKSAASAVYLNTDLYDGVRASVLRKLGQAAEDYLDSIPGFQ